ncbi:MAG: hypothetical protein AAB486_02860 [Patescibacteria group bacterium]
MINLIYIYNLAEDAETLVAGMSDKAQKKVEIEEDLGLADHEFFLGKNNKIIISSNPVSGEFIGYVRSVTGHRQITNLSPKSENPNLCRAISEDRKFFRNLVALVRSCEKPPKIISYATTPYFIELVNHLRKFNLKFITPDLGEPSSVWTRDYFGSKSGFRQFINLYFPHDRLVKMPEGFVASNPAEAAKIAADIYLKNKGVVIKINRGHAGAGLKIFTPGSLPGNYEKITKLLLKLFGRDSYWRREPVVVEKLVPVDWKIGGGSPNIELIVKPGGRVEKLYACGMRVTPEGVFKGVEAGRRALPFSLERKLEKIGFSIGKRYAKAGYRGSFEVDLVINKKGGLYCTESNLRKTGGTFVYDLGINLFGKGFLNSKFCLSHNLFFHDKLKKMDFARLYRVLAPVLYPIGESTEGLVISGVSLLKTGRFGYVIFADSKKRAYSIEAKMTKLLSTSFGLQPLK